MSIRVECKVVKSSTDVFLTLKFEVPHRPLKQFAVTVSSTRNLSHGLAADVEKLNSNTSSQIDNIRNILLKRAISVSGI